MWKTLAYVAIALVIGYFIGVYWPVLGNKVSGK